MGVAVHGWDGAAPETLARHEPVAQPVVDLALADPLLLEPLDGPNLRLRGVEAVEEATVDLRALAAVRAAPIRLPSLRRPDRAHHGQAVQGGENPVTLVLGRHGHDRPGPVTHEDVVGHVEGHGRSGERIHHVGAGEGAPLLERGGIALGHALHLAFRGGPGPEVVDDGPLPGCGDLVDQRVLGRHDGVGHPEGGVGSGGEDPDRQVGAALHGEVELGPLGSADPVALHDLGPFGPLERVDGLEQLVGVGGDA